MAKRQFDKMNDLARKFYERAGKEIEEGYDFSRAAHGEEQMMFALAYDAFNYFDEDVRKHGIEMKKLKADLECLQHYIKERKDTKISLFMTEIKALKADKLKMADAHLNLVDKMLAQYEILKEELRVTQEDLKHEKDRSLEDL